MPIYTKKGDKGTTSIFKKEKGKAVRVSKADLLIETIGSVDEANSYLGILRSILIKGVMGIDLKKEIEYLQKDLFTIGSMLAGSKLQISDGRVGEFEDNIDKMDQILPKLTNFILPGGSEISAGLMFSRTLVRRAERRVVALTKIRRVNPTILIYLNRLSDYLFVLARWVNFKNNYKEMKWSN